MYWKITPHAEPNYDYCILPAYLNEPYSPALEYAIARLAENFYAMEAGGDVFVLTIELCDDEISGAQDE